MRIRTGSKVNVKGEDNRNPGIVRLLPGGSNLYMIEFTQFDSWLARWLWVPREKIEAA